MAMTPERWQQMKAALHEALQLQAEPRDAFLEHLASHDPDLSAEVQRLLAASDELQADFLEGPAAAELEEFAPDPLVGQRLGPYQVLEKIGAGGMGEVYRAIRADGEYRQEVAIKLVHAEFASSLVLARLRQERQILASLDHPNITRLLDGGRTPQGVPYLVMELIEGEPIHRYCERNALGTEQRLRLFVHVCQAVHYAHQRLIIHRDIKPSNILVTPAGVPKLLDFGIAKILDPTLSRDATGPAAPTMSVVRLFTPGYASPEQLKGDPITTSSDVYSLGVVMRDLFSSRPRDLNLEFIVRMAMRPEPDKRYSSAEALATDINRYLDRLPVIARRNTLKYRLSTFIARHTAGIVTGALLALLLLGATIVSVYEAQTARAERARAERRFNDARRVANSLMGEIYGSIKDLAGATPARKLLVSKALEYLDGLSSDSLSDSALARELATAYSLVGDVQGNPYYANLGDTPGALDSYSKALTIRLRLSASAPSDVDAVRAIAASYNQIGAEIGVARDFAAAVPFFEAAALLLERVDRNSQDAIVLDQLAGTYYFLAEAALRAGDLAQAKTSIHRASVIRDGINTGDAVKLRQVHTHSAGDHSVAARIFITQKKYVDALREQRQAVDIMLSLATGNSADATVASYVGQGFDYLGRIYEYLDDRDGAMQSYLRARQTLEPILAADPKNIFAAALVAHSYERVGTLQDTDPASSKAGSLEIAAAIKLITPLRAQAPDNVELTSQFGYAYAELGDAQRTESVRNLTNARQRAQLLESACAAYRKSHDIWRGLERDHSLDNFEKTADFLAEVDRSVEHCEQQLAHRKAAKSTS